MSHLALLGGTPVMKADEYKARMFHWPIVNDAMRKAQLDVLEAGNMSGTDISRRFEQEFAKWNGTKYALAHNTGTASLQAAMFGIGLGVGLGEGLGLAVGLTVGRVVAVGLLEGTTCPIGGLGLAVGTTTSSRFAISSPAVYMIMAAPIAAKKGASLAHLSALYPCLPFTHSKAPANSGPLLLTSEPFLLTSKFSFMLPSPPFGLRA